MNAIPVQNIYYLLCYAWNKLEEKDVTDVAADDSTRLIDLFGKILAAGTTHLFKRGLDRDYLQFDEDTRRLRGKINFGPTLRRALLQTGKINCSYDELSYNVLHNQILKSTIRRLFYVPALDRKIGKDLAALYRRFPAVDDIEITGQDFGRVRLHRNNYYYDFLLKVCRIIHENLLIDERTGEYKFMDFDRNETKMRLMFEEFVRNFYRLEQTTFSVDRDYLNWQTDPAGQDDHFLPRMQTDISLYSASLARKIVIDTKFSQTTLIKSYHSETEKVKTGNLYQMYAYLKNLEYHDGPGNENCEGMLLYPTVAEPVDLNFSLPGHRLRVCTINLDQEWTGIHQDLIGLLGVNAN